MIGTVSITGALKYGQTLTAPISNTNNTGTLSYQWKRGTTTISGATSSKYKLVTADIGKRISYTVASAITATLKAPINELTVTYPIRCKIVDEDGFIAYTSEACIKLKEADPIVITSQPVDWYGKYGQKASFDVTATGEGLTYQWQYRKSGTWCDYAIATADTPNFKVTMNEKNVKWAFRCVITDANGNVVTTNEVFMKLQEEEPVPQGITITSQPSDFTGRIGKKASFSVTATGEGLTYEWQVNKSGSWSAYTLAGYDTPNFQVSINDKTATWTYRCVIRDANGNEVATSVVHIYVEG